MNPFFTDIEYQQKCIEVFNTEYNRWSNLAILCKSGKWWTQKVPRFSIQTALQNYIKRKEVFAACPVKDNKAHLFWFDIDSHSDSIEIQQEAHQVALKIYNYLNVNKISATFAQSSTFGNYHIRMRFRVAQDTQYGTVIQRGILKTLGLPQTIEFGPKNARQIRPWFVGNDLKPAGHIIFEGRENIDFTNLDHLYKVGQVVKHMHICETKGEFDVAKYIPNGVYLKRNKALMLLIEDCVRFNFSSEQIFKYAQDIYKSGVVKDTLEEHMAQAKYIYKYYSERPSGTWEFFWNTYQKGHTALELVQAMQDFARKNNWETFPLSVRTLCNYQGVSLRTAWKRLQKLEELKHLVVATEGSRYRATRYKVNNFPLDNTDNFVTM